MTPSPTGALARADPRTWAAPIAAITVFGLSISFSLPLVALLLERAGISGFWIGLNTAAAAVATVLFAPLMPRLMAAIGLGRLMIWAGLGLAAAMAAFTLSDSYGWWTVLRLVFGFCATALFFTSEYWIVAGAPEGGRGRVVALYTISLSLAFALGPVLLGVVGVDGVLPFLLAAAVLVAGTLPILWGLPAAPPATAEAPPSPRTTLRFFVTDPGLIWAVVLFGMIEFGAVGLLPVWAVRTGLSETQAVWVAASFAAGAVLSALALGAAADRYDRRKLLALVAAVSLAAPLAMSALPGVVPAVLCGLVWGGAAVGLYTLPLVELGARYSGHRLAEGNGAVVMAYGIGALAAPTALGTAMDLVPPHGLLWLAALATAAYLVLVTTRIALDSGRARGE